MTDLHHPLTPWTREHTTAILREQIDRNTRDRDRKIVAAYSSGLSMRQIGDRFGITSSAVSDILHRDAPNLVRPPARPRNGGDAAD